LRIKISKPTETEISEMKQNPIWECEPSEFPWQYDMTETCYLLEGKVKVITDEEEVEFCSGDMVTFPKGLACTWQVQEKVRKHYTFSD
jgi:uncharacterized cupin superfamily protein